MAQWKDKLISVAGKEVLIKSVTQAILTYTMNLFWLPKGIVSDIQALYRDFWWSFNKDKNKIYWKFWQKLCTPKSRGGLGFRDVEAFAVFGLSSSQGVKMSLFPFRQYLKWSSWISAIINLEEFILG